MKTLGIIAEYNPFHFGHKHHLENSMEKTNSDYSIAVMSGSFLQRGEPSFVDKWTKAKMAINNGIDLVLELPFLYSTQSAEYFAYGGVKLLDSLNIVDYISFGSESGKIEELSYIATILNEEPENYIKALKYNLNKGLSFSVSRSNALESYIYSKKPNQNKNYNHILKQSNNILAIEYLKALSKINSNINPITIKRSGSDYKDLSFSDGFSSATAIRKTIKENGLKSAKKFIPIDSYLALEEYLDKYTSFNYLENYQDILIYLLRTTSTSKMKDLLNIEQGLENRFIEKAFSFNDINKIIEKVSSKRYPKTRIQRTLIHLLHNLYMNDFLDMEDFYPSYIRVLGMNQNGFKILNKIKNNSNIPIITKFANYKNFNNDSIDKIINYDKISTDIFFMGLKNIKVFANQDYLISPYIK